MNYMPLLPDTKQWFSAFPAIALGKFKLIYYRSGKVINTPAIHLTLTLNFKAALINNCFKKYFYQYILHMKSHLFVFISLLVFPYSFTKKEVARVNFADIRTELNKISVRLNVHTVTETASSSISAFIDSGVKSYNDAPSDDNFKKIIDNFPGLLLLSRSIRNNIPAMPEGLSSLLFLFQRPELPYVRFIPFVNLT
jgi:hypothetical protein